MAFQYLVANCPPLVPFPSGPILSPNLNFFYNKSVVEEFYDSTIFFRKTSRSFTSSRVPHWFISLQW
jgi:hypothetical protein